MWNEIITYKGERKRDRQMDERVGLELTLWQDY